MISRMISFTILICGTFSPSVFAAKDCRLYIRQPGILGLILGGRPPLEQERAEYLQTRLRTLAANANIIARLLDTYNRLLAAARLQRERSIQVASIKIPIDGRAFESAAKSLAEKNHGLLIALFYDAIRRITSSEDIVARGAEAQLSLVTKALFYFELNTPDLFLIPSSVLLAGLSVRDESANNTEINSETEAQKRRFLFYSTYGFWDDLRNVLARVRALLSAPQTRREFILQLLEHESRFGSDQARSDPKLESSFIFWIARLRNAEHYPVATVSKELWADLASALQEFKASNPEHQLELVNELLLQFR